MPEHVESTSGDSKSLSSLGRAAAVARFGEAA
jgi:hypothetical protein